MYHYPGRPKRIEASGAFRQRIFLAGVCCTSFNEEKRGLIGWFGNEAIPRHYSGVSFVSGKHCLALCAPYFAHLLGVRAYAEVVGGRCVEVFVTVLV